MDWLNNFDDSIKQVFVKEKLLDDDNKKMKKIFTELKGLKKSGDKYKFIANAIKDQGKNSIKDIYKIIYEYASESKELLLKNATKVEDLVIGNHYTKIEISSISNFWNVQTGILFNKESKDVFITISDDYIYKINGIDIKVKNVINENFDIKYYAQSNGHSSTSIYNSKANNEIRNKIGGIDNKEIGFIHAFKTIDKNKYQYIGKYITKEEVIEKDKTTGFIVLYFNLVRHDKLTDIEKQNILNYSEYNNIKNFENIVNEEIPSTEVETKKALVKVRWQQGRWRKQLMDKYNQECILTKLKHEDLLIASHIKPYSKCNRDEACDVENGLLLSALADKLFDKGLMTFNENGEIILSKELERYDDIKKIKKHIDINFRLMMTEKMRKYMKYHFEKEFIDNKK